MAEPALSLQIATTVHHRIHTTTARMDSVGWVVSGTKHLVTPGGGHRYPSGRVFVLGLGLALVFGLLSGAYPAYKMSKLPAIKALKGELGA